MPDSPTIIKPHGNRRKVFPNAHQPICDLFKPETLVTKIIRTKKQEVYSIFEEEPSHFRSENTRLGSALQSLFKNNILFLCDLYGISRNDLFRQINNKGVRGNSKAFIHGNGRKHFSLLYLAQFSRIFNIEPALLIGVDLRKLLW